MPDTLILDSGGQPIALLPLSALSWKKAIPEMWTGEATVLHYYEDWAVRSPSVTLQVPAVMMRKTHTGNRAVRFNRRNVFLRDDYTCQYCGGRFDYGELTFDHVIPQCRGGKTNWTNIVSACSPCNNRRGHKQHIKPDRLPYRPTYWEMAEKITKLPIVVPHETWTYYLHRWNPELITVKTKH